MNGSKRNGIAFAILLIACISIIVWLHILAGYSFPIPWEDEAVFVMQGKALADHGTLLNPSLNPYRVIEWMPPGYMVFLSAALRIGGNPIFISRLCSLLLEIMSFLLLSIMVWKQKRGAILLLLFLGLCFANRYMILMGNMARMEPLVLAMVTLSIFLFQSQKNSVALGLLLLTPLVHPNGVLFLAAGLVYYFRVEGWSWKRLTPSFIILWSLIFTVWIFYGFHIAQHWNSFVYDMTQQMQRKIGRHIFKPMMDVKLLSLLGGIFVMGIYSWFKKDRWLLLLSGFAAASWLVNRIGQELWYDAYDILAVILLLIALLSWVMKSGSKFLKVITFGIAICVGYIYGVVENPLLDPHKYTLLGLKMEETVEYMSRTDVERIRGYILSHKSSAGKIRVKFEPRGDALFFQTSQDSLIEPIHTHIDTTMFPMQQHDLYIVHVSRYLPPVWKKYPIDWAFVNAGIDPAMKKYELFRRDETEVWYTSIPAE